MLFPPEVWAQVFPFLPPRDLQQVSLVSRSMNASARERLYRTVHVYHGVNIELLKRTLKARQKDRWGHLVRRIILYEVRWLHTLPLDDFPALTPNVELVDFPPGYWTTYVVDLFRHEPAWPCLQRIPLWHSGNAHDLLALRHLTSLDCHYTVIVDLAGHSLPTLKKLTVRDDEIRFAYPRGYSTIRFLDTIQVMAPQLEVLKFATPVLEQKDEHPPAELACIVPALTVRRLTIDLLRINQGWVDYLHVKYPNLVALGLSMVEDIRLPGEDESTMQRTVDLRACHLEEVFLYLGCMEINADEAPLDLVRAMLPCHTLPALGHPHPLPHPLKSFTWRAHKYTPISSSLFIFGHQLVDLTLTLERDSVVLCWLGLCLHHRPCFAAGKSNNDPLPTMRRLCLHGVDGNQPPSDRGTRIVVPWDLLLRRFAHITHLTLAAGIKVVSSNDTDMPRPIYRHLRGFISTHVLFDSGNTLEDLLLSCPKLIDLALLTFSFEKVPDSPHHPIVVNTPDRDYRRVCGFSNIDPQLVTTSTSQWSLDVELVPKHAVNAQSTSPVPVSEAKTVRLRCRSVFRHAKRYSGGHFLYGKPFSFDFIHVLEDE
ncbi:hypothetical protein BC940DRAFT_354765 [Gongronella butleri]|nr:hypothetical protein BC940DRAFT_354765 [Gongronella butleri]